MSSKASFAALLAALVVAACDQTSTDPGSSSIQFSRSISLPDAQTLLQSGPSRVEVRVIPATLVARRVEIETSEEFEAEQEAAHQS